MKTVLQRLRSVLPALALLFVLSSCVDGYKDESIWMSTVRDAQLENPEMTIKSSPDGTELIINWSVVAGAGGYEVSVYNVDDPNNPIAIGEENQMVDGFEVRRPATEDTKFLAKVRTLDNKKMNNKGAAAPVEKAYDNLLPVFQTIPTGTNLTEYFAANVPTGNEELCYELAPSGEYTMNGNLSFGQTPVTIRGSKTSHAKIEVTDGSFVSEGAKLKLQFIDMSYKNFTGDLAKNALLLMSSNFPTTGINDKGYKVVPSIMLQSCKVSDLPFYIFWDNGKKYGIASMLIKDCVIGHSTSVFKAALIRFQSGMVKDLTITNSTLYNDNPPTSDISQRFIQISSGNATSVGGDWLSGSMSITNCTFWQVAKNNALGNSNGAMRTGSDKVTIQKNVFVDCGKTTNNMWELRLRNANQFTGGQNSQWFNGVDLYTSGTSESSRDINPVTGDPGLSYLGNGKFSMTGAAQIAAGTGDPRWLP